MMLEPSSMFRDRVRERDLDNFLIEELHSSRPFREWLLAQFAGVFQEPSLCEVRLQKSPPRIQDNRQTDVRMGWFTADGKLRACVLIESKVTAGFEEGQASAYAAEAAAHRSTLGTHAVATALVAPEARMRALSHDGAFDREISIESIILALEDRLRGELPDEIASRISVRIDLLESLCGRKRGSQWTPVTIETKRDFAEAYVVLAREIVPTLHVRPSTDGPKAITRIFEGLSLEPEFSSIKLRHEFGSNVATKYANVQLSGFGDKVQALQSSKVFSGTPYYAAEAGKALAIRVNTPGIDPTLPFDRERDKVAAGLKAVRDLAAWMDRNRCEIAELIQENKPRLESDPEVAARKNARDPREAEFTSALWNTYRECEKLGYKPTGMLDMIERLGGIATARALLAKPPSDGFARLAILQRLDLAIEAIVQQPQWAGLFSDEELRTARRRLT
jgi:hypothetical protein